MQESDFQTTGSQSGPRTWFNRLHYDLQARIYAETGLGIFIGALRESSRRSDRCALRALAERWVETTHTFHLPIGEMTLTPFDFHAITGIEFEGAPVPFDASYWSPARHADVVRLLGFYPERRGTGSSLFAYPLLMNHWLDRAPVDINEEDQLIRCFVLYLLGCTLFSDGSNTVSLSLLRSVENVAQIHTYNWGAAALAYLYHSLDRVSYFQIHRVYGYSEALEVILLFSFFSSFFVFFVVHVLPLTLQDWAYELGLLLGPRPYPLSVYPRLHRWVEAQHEAIHDLATHRAYLNSLTWNQVFDALHFP